MISINRRAADIVQRMIDDAEALELAVVQLENGATVVDAGVKVPGSLAAGRLFAKVCLGGLAKIHLCELDLEGTWLPGVSVAVSHPVVACMASQYAGWAVKKDKFFAMGSGPARALYRGEPLFEKLDYQDQADVAVLALEGRKLPPEGAAQKVADKCGVAPDHLFLPIAIEHRGPPW